MILEFKDISLEARENWWEKQTYQVKCPKCKSVELIDIDYKSEWINGEEEVTITLECCKCGTRFKKIGIKLEVYRAEYDDEINNKN